MKKFIKIIDDMTLELDLMDLGLFKSTLIITGIIIGTVFPKMCKNLRPFLLIVWMCLFSYLMIKLFILPLHEQLKFND
ncbi:hypothetical protein AN641_01090 [Candidatus Epulonipiscioides gigas]|nr:hypothetical protein AN641_01090 [Epulopiscium sp. SCG-C07WGA-EpuloA2]